ARARGRDRPALVGVQGRLPVGSRPRARGPAAARAERRAGRRQGRHRCRSDDLPPLTRRRAWDTWPAVTGLTVRPLLADAVDRAFPDADVVSAWVRYHALFAPGEQIVIARAPGRFDVLGGIADYAGGVVLGLPIRDAALAAAQVVSDGRVIVASGSRRLAIAAADLLRLPP